MLPDEICDAYAERGVQLTIRVLEGDDGSVLIEGKPISLRMLGLLLLSMADEQPCDGFEISPTSAGSIFFSSEATHGVYIHVIE